MNIGESVRLALGSLRTNKMRSFLTLLGIIVGIASVIAILTLGHALKVQTNESIASSGANDLMVQVRERPKDDVSDSKAKDPYAAFAGSGQPIDLESKIDEDEIALIKKVMGDKIAGIPIGSTNTFYVPFAVGENNMESNVQLVNSDYLKLNPLNIVAGRNISDTDIETKRATVVISESSAATLFGSSQEAIGQEVEMNTATGTNVAVVVGIYRIDDAGSIFSFQNDMTSYIPYTVGDRFSTSVTNAWDTITVRPAAGADLVQTKSQLQAVLTQLYQSNETFEAEIMDFSASTASFNQVLSGISAAISGIAGISLLVGGIGVMNIMLVTVTERTREIGIRKALGATRSAIRTQFVVEAMMVCLVGGLLGVLGGGILGYIGSSFMKQPVLPPAGAVLISLGFSLAIGLFFGYYPANKAAKLEPIDALRYE